jgi:putative acetyltransferase
VQLHPADLTDPRVLSLLRLHLSALYALTPAEHAYALDTAGLSSPDIDLWTAWDDHHILGCAAIKQLHPTHGEIKSMRTHPAHLRRGVATRLLHHLITIARDRGYHRLSLETGTGPAFEPAVTLYQRHGFTHGPAFADYHPSDHNQFLHLDL